MKRFLGGILGTVLMGLTLNFAAEGCRNGPPKPTPSPVCDHYEGQCPLQTGTQVLPCVLNSIGGCDGSAS